MTKTHDISAELQALQDRARQLKARQKAEIGRAILATGAEQVFSPDELIGLVLAGLEQASANPAAREGWRRRGEAFRKASGSGKPGGQSRPAAGLAQDPVEPMAAAAAE
ncbi:conjugal transfer protein TraD [Roseomonas mucosa]|uniref:conjugal transfer protein TraD n=1 Tax=Roseomonas mucosa TaxID=207340 RepID=UPI0028CBC3EF|nr:conjugal transfer protein TraD [Roseomonas mucosa]MDT8278496.1 conjugal transfer protein TraD [Roseomonas mucosa]